MAQIIPFPQDEVRRGGTIPEGTGCHVMIFPGVRIERHDDGVDAEHDSRPRTGT